MKTLRRLDLEIGVIADFDASEKMMFIYKSIPALKEKNVYSPHEWWFVFWNYRSRNESGKRIMRKS
jgi:hypothetical protein